MDFLWIIYNLLCYRSYVYWWSIYLGVGWRKEMIRLIGDIHGEYEWYLGILQNTKELNIPTLQIGDFGLGFHLCRDRDLIIDNKVINWSQNKFIRGNHDDPEACKQVSGYLGDFGYLEDKGIFFISGGYSIDKDWRLPGVSWWEEEELTVEQMEQCKALYLKERPQYVVAHELPRSAVQAMYFERDKGIDRFPNRTAAFLQELVELHSPYVFYAGHHHVNWTYTMNGTQFRVIKDLHFIDVDI